MQARIISVVFCVMWTSAGHIRAQDVPAVPSEPHVVVVGVGEAMAKTDYLELSVGVTLARDTGAEASAAVDERLLAISHALLELGIEQEHLIVNAMELSIGYDWNVDPPTASHVEAARTIDITLHDIEKFDAVANAASLHGATELHQPTPRSHQEASLVKQAQVRAIQQARDHAAALAEGFGQSLGPVYSIASGEVRSWRLRSGGAGGGGLFGDPADRSRVIESLSYTPRPVERRMTVYAVFLLGPPLAAADD